MKKYLSNLAVIFSLIFVGCGCETVSRYGLKTSAEWFRFGTHHVFMNITDYSYEDCPSITGSDATVDRTRYFALGLDTNEIIEITESVREWRKMELDDDLVKYGRVYMDSPLTSMGVTSNFVGKFWLRLTVINGEFQTWILDPYRKPQVQKLGEPWGKNYLDDNPSIGSYFGEYGFRQWGKDSFLIDLSRKDLEKMKIDVPHYYVQSLATGQVSIMDFVGNNGGRWNDVIRFGDTIMTLRKVDSTLGYLYRFVNGRKDSIPLPGIIEKLNFESIYHRPKHPQKDARMIATAQGRGGGYTLEPLALTDWVNGWQAVGNLYQTKNCGDSICLYENDSLRQIYPYFESW